MQAALQTEEGAARVKAADEANELMPTAHNGDTERLMALLKPIPISWMYSPVIPKQLRISPSSSGSSHRFFCSGVAKRESISMLPVSGALQLNT